MSVNRFRRMPKANLLNLILMVSFLVALVSSLSGIFALVQMNKIKDKTNVLADVWLSRVIKNGEVAMNVALYRKLEIEYWNAKSVEDRKKIEEKIDEANGNLTIYMKNLSKLIEDEKSTKVYDELDKNWTTYADLHDKFMTAVKGNKLDDANKLVNKEQVPVFNAILDSVTKLSDENFQGSMGARDESQGILAQSKIIVGSIIVTSIIVSILLSYFIARIISRKIKIVIEKIEEGSGLLSQSTNQIAESSMKLSESVTEQVSAIHETAHSLDEINKKVEINSQTSHETLVASNINIEVANEGIRNMQDVLGAINDLSIGIEELSKKINEGNRDIEGIVSIISEISTRTNVINDIVFQTKLLSFNASVEAARAGEVGKGFAVVAEEVGNLATLSGKAATEISSILESSISKVNQIVNKISKETSELVRENKLKLVKGNEVSEQCNQSLTKIISNIHSVNSKLTELNQSSSDQSQAIKEISKAIHQLNESSNMNSKVANITSSEATTIENQVNSLTEVVSQLASIV